MISFYQNVRKLMFISVGIGLKTSITNRPGLFQMFSFVNVCVGFYARQLANDFETINEWIWNFDEIQKSNETVFEFVLLCNGFIMKFRSNWFNQSCLHLKSSVFHFGFINGWSIYLHFLVYLVILTVERLVFRRYVYGTWKRVLWYFFVGTFMVRENAREKGEFSKKK